VGKRIVELGAAAVILVSSGAKGDTRDWVRRESTGSAATLKQLPLMLQGAIVAKRFANAKTVDEFRTAEAISITLRPKLARYEMSLSCKDYGSSHDKEIAVDLVEDVFKKPVGLIIDVGKLVISLAGGEKDETLENLKDAAKDFATLAKDKGIERALESPTIRGKINERFKEALLKYLQAHSKRSRKYFLQVIADIGSVAKAYGGVALKIGEIALTPSRINPEECGSEEWIESERDSALRRVFSSAVGIGITRD
jgi:hypothetical protein